MTDDMKRSRSLGEALQGAVFPLSAEQLIQVARENEAPSSVLSLLGTLPRTRFASLDAVERALEGDSPDAREHGAEPQPHR